MVASHLSKRAAEAFSYFEKATRTNGAEFWKTKDGAPEWVKELCYAAHNSGSLLPDDWRYAFIVEALIALEEGGELEADVYTSELCAWLASRVSRTEYVDEAREERGAATGDIFEQLQWGQLAEKREVFDLVSAFLEELIDEEEDVESDDEDADDDEDA